MRTIDDLHEKYDQISNEKKKKKRFSFCESRTHDLRSTALMCYRFSCDSISEYCVNFDTRCIGTFRIQSLFLLARCEWRISVISHSAICFFVAASRTPYFLFSRSFSYHSFHKFYFFFRFFSMLFLLLTISLFILSDEFVVNHTRVL